MTASRSSGLNGFRRYASAPASFAVGGVADVAPGQHDNADLARARVALQLLAEGEAARAGEPEVEDDDVGLVLGDPTAGLRDTGRLHDLDVDHLEGRAEQDAEALVVVDDEHADGVERPGRRASGANERPWPQGSPPRLERLNVEARERGRGQIGHRRDERVIDVEARAGRHQRQDHPKHCAVVDERRGHCLIARQSRGCQLGELPVGGLDELGPAEAAEDDSRCRRLVSVGNAADRRGEREATVLLCEEDSDAGSAGQLDQLPCRQVGDSAAARRSRDRVRQMDERIRGSGDGALQLTELGALDAVAGGAGLEHRIDDGTVVETGEGDDAHVRKGGSDPSGRLDAVENRHADIHEDHVRRKCQGEVDGLPSVARLADDDDLRFRGQLCSQDEPKGLRVVADEQANHPLASLVSRGSPSKKAGKARTCG